MSLDSSSDDEEGDEENNEEDHEKDNEEALFEVNKWIIFPILFVQPGIWFCLAIKVLAKLLIKYKI